MINTERKAGLLLAVSSLPGTFGIGDLGQDAFDFVDKLSKTNAKYWQILPLNPVGYGNSPYQTYSAFAGDEIYISIENLYETMSLPLTTQKVVTNSADYDHARELKTKYLKRAFEVFEPTAAYKTFLKEAFWLKEYAEFMALREVNDHKSWIEWTIFDVDKKALEYQYFLQYVFYTQWMKLKQYANEMGIKIMGDIPIYLGHDSAEVYFNRELFHLDVDGRPLLVAGVPPDYFSDEGQLWGNPIYDWDGNKKGTFKFWVKRLKWNQHLYDTVRLDHFRAFDTYWTIPGDATTAKDGEWRIGPRHEFFDEMYKNIDNLELVVEDLGDLRPEVLELRDDFNLMGMQIIQFALKTEEIQRDTTMNQNILAYTGTHDNQPLGGWADDNGFLKKLQVRRDIGRLGIREFNIIDLINHYALSLNANLVILPAQDIMRLGDHSQMNRPGTVGSPNWEWKLTSLNSLDAGLDRFKTWIKKTNRQ